jgi:hypothetical protein
MRAFAWICLAGVVALASPLAGAERDNGLAGTWKVVIHEQEQQGTLCLIEFSSKDGKPTGKVIASDPQFGKPAVTKVKQSPELVSFQLEGEGRRFSFEGRPQKGVKKIVGSLDIGGRMFLADLQITTLKDLNASPFDLSKDTLATHEGGGIEVMNAARTLLAEAGRHKATAAEVRGWADRLYKAAEAYGPRYQRQAAVDIARALTPQADTAAVAVEYARRAERMITPKDSPVTQKMTLQTVAAALRSAGKEAEANEVDAREQKIDWVKVSTYPGRKGKSNRAVLVELFTGAECPPCVAADVAFDALRKTYKPSDVVLLEYHLHVPGPDPLTNPATEARSKYYGDVVEGTPTILFNGKAEAGGGGGMAGGQGKYEEYTLTIDPLLEKPGDAKLKASAVRNGDKIEIAAEAADVDGPPEKLRLRVALVEEQVKYTGGNKLPMYHHVVRALPGGPAGVTLKDRSAKQTVTVDLKELREQLTKYLTDSGKENPFPRKDRPLDLKHLQVVAFVQNDDTREVLQAVTAEVIDKE